MPSVIESPSVIIVTAFEAIKTFSELSKVLRAKPGFFVLAHARRCRIGIDPTHCAGLQISTICLIKCKWIEKAAVYRDRKPNESSGMFVYHHNKKTAG